VQRKSIGVHLMGMYKYLMGMYLMDIHFIGVHVMGVGVHLRHTLYGRAEHTLIAEIINSRS